MKTKQTKLTRNQRLAIAMGCLLLSNWWQAPAVLAEEQTDKAVITEEVDVTDTRLKERQAIQKTEITSEDIKAQGAANAAQVLEKAAGITVSDNNMSGKASVSIRGSDANNTKVFVDGVPLSPVGNGVVDLSSIAADSIEKIEVIKGTAPVRYGSDAAGGVIYITTKKGTKSGGSMSLASGGWNTQTGSFSLSGSTEKANYFFSAKRMMTDGYTANTEEDANTYNGKIGVQLNDRTSASLFGAYTKKIQELPDRFDENGLLMVNPGDGGMIGQGDYSVDFWTGMANMHIDPSVTWHSGLSLKHEFSENNDLNLTLYKSRDTSYMTGTNKVASATGVFVSGGQDSAGGVSGFQLDHVFKTGPNNTVTWGYMKERRSFDQDAEWYNLNVNTNQRYDFASRAQYRYDSHSYFLQDELKLGRLTASAGFRHNVIDDSLTAQLTTWAGPQTPSSARSSYRSNNPVAGISYALNDTLSLHSSIGKSFRYPRPEELTGGAMVGTGTGVKPEETLNREVGVAYSPASGLNVDVTVFNKKVDNLIQSKYYGAQLIPTNLAEEMTMKGFEAVISQKLNDKLKAFAQVTYTSAENPELGRQVNDVPERKYSVGLNYAGSQGLNANLSVSYVGSRFSQFSNGVGGGSPDDPNGRHSYDLVNLPAYSSVDLKVSKELKDREYYVKFYNLFDKQYYKGAYLIAPGRYVEFGTDIKF